MARCHTASKAAVQSSTVFGSLRISGPAEVPSPVKWLKRTTCSSKSQKSLPGRAMSEARRRGSQRTDSPPRCSTPFPRTRSGCSRIQARRRCGRGGWSRHGRRLRGRCAARGADVRRGRTGCRCRRTSRRRSLPPRRRSRRRLASPSGRRTHGSWRSRHGSSGCRAGAWGRPSRCSYRALRDAAVRELAAPDAPLRTGERNRYPPNRLASPNR